MPLPSVTLVLNYPLPSVPEREGGVCGTDLAPRGQTSQNAQGLTADDETWEPDPLLSDALWPLPSDQDTERLFSALSRSFFPSTLSTSTQHPGLPFGPSNRASSCSDTLRPASLLPLPADEVLWTVTLTDQLLTLGMICGIPIPKH